jgi:GMP synthase (glutamine-hydrolysing)
MMDDTRALHALLFHPEVVHTQFGLEILRNFAYGVCGCSGDWTMASFVEEATARVKAQVGDRRVVCGLSGGVDSTVAALIIHRAIGRNLTCILVTTACSGWTKPPDRKRFERNPSCSPTRQAVLERLAGVVEPEQKRKIIGATFIDVFEERGEVDGLIFWRRARYPDVIESVARGIPRSSRAITTSAAYRRACG